MAESVDFYRHGLGDEEKRRVLAALEGPILTSGQFTAEAEQALADYLHASHVVCLDSCTAALHLALLAHDIGPGDEVIVPAMTFVATANAALMAGARPVFADVDPRTGNLTVETVADLVSPRTRAIIPVHLYGLLCDMPALHAFAAARGLVLIEDAAHCVEARRGTSRPASHSHCACLSFYATKNITCGEGGALVTNDAALAERVRRLAQHGMTSTAADRYGRQYKHWDMHEWGWKYNLDNIRAALIPPQVRRLDANWARRRAIAGRYEEAFRRAPGIDLPLVDEELASARHLFPIWVDDRDAVLERLQEEGLGVTVNYRSVHLLSYYQREFGYRRGELPAAERIGDRTLSLPFYPQMSESQVQRVIDVVTRVMSESSRSRAGRGAPVVCRSMPVKAAVGPMGVQA